MSAARSRTEHPTPRVERGAGLLGTASGVAAFLALLTVAMQILLQLRASSTVRTAAYDAARAVATVAGPIDAAELAAGERRGRALLGDLGDEATFDWDTSDPSTIRLRLTTPAPDLLVPVVAGVLGGERLGSEAVVRREAVRP